jgi:hypothetical protein
MIEFLIGVFLLLIILDAGIEGLAVGSPLSATIFAVLVLCVAANVIFIFKRGNFHVGVETTACAFIALVGYTTWRYGSIDTGAFSLLKHPPAVLFNFIFLAVYLFALGALLLQKGRSLAIRLALSVLVIYGLSGIVENLFQGILHSQVWNLEDTLLGTQLWKWMPLYYLRPTLFSFWILLPLLIFTFLFSKGVKAEGVPTGRLGQHGFMVLLLLFAFFLGSVILQNNRIPNFLSLLTTPSLGVGQTTAANASGGSQSYNIEVATYNLNSERTNDLALPYRMAAYFSPSPDGKRNISLNVRSVGGHVVPFLNSKDLLVFQDDAVQRPIRIKFRPEQLLAPKDIVVMIDRSSTMAPQMGFVQSAVRDWYDLTNSRERTHLASFADDVKGIWIPNRSELSKQISALLGQGTRNLDGAFTRVLKTLDENPKSQKAIFLITAADAVAAEPTLSTVAGRLKAQKTRLYVLSLGAEQVPDSLKTLSESSGGKAFGIAKGQDLSPALIGSFADAFGEYQINYEGQSFIPKLQITSPEEGAEVLGDTPLVLKILNSQDVKLGSARLSMDGKVIQELPAQGQAQISFILSPAQLPKGAHTFKASVVAEDGKEYSKELKLTLRQELEFRFIRPLDGDVVSGPENLEVYFKPQAQNPLIRVDFMIDGQKVGEASSEPYLYTWDTQTQTGTHTLEAIGNFSDGSTKTDQIKVNVFQGFSLRIVSPSLGEFLSNVTEIEADVTHSLSDLVQKVEFFADGESLVEVNQPPFKYLWDNSGLSSGRHVIQARVTSSSNMTSTDAVIVNIGSGSLSVQLAEAGAGGSASLSPDFIEWVLDASSSMNGELEGRKKIDLAKQAMSDILPKIPANTQVAYRWFGSQSPATHHDCKDSLLAYPMKPAESNKIVTQLGQVEARGLDPLGFTLEKVRADMKASFGSRVVVLITDGNDDCGGDPVGELERWKKEKLNAKLYVVGIDLEGTRAQTELKRLAEISGGQYFSVSSEKEMISALEDMVKVTYRILDYKDHEVAQRPVGAPALPLRTGEYRVELDVDPPLSKKVLINNGVEKKLFLKKEGNSFSLDEQ